LLAPPHRGGATPLEDSFLNDHFASAKRRRPDRALLLLCPFLPPLSHETAGLPTQSPTPNTLNSQFFKDLPSEIVGFGVHFSYLAIPARAFFGDLPHNSFISLWVFFTPIRGTFYGLSWAILGPSWGRLSVPRRGPCTSRWTFLCFPMNLSGYCSCSILLHGCIPQYILG